MEVLMTFKKEALESQNNIGKGENAGNKFFAIFQQHFLPHKMQKPLFKHIWFSSAIAFSLGGSIILPFAEDLMQIHVFCWWRTCFKILLASLCGEYMIEYRQSQSLTILTLIIMSHRHQMFLLHQIRFSMEEPKVL